MTVRKPAKAGTRKRRTIVEETLPEDFQEAEEPVNDFDVSLEQVEDAETLKGVLEQFGITEAVLYRIYRQTPTGPPSFCYESTTFDETFLQRERGAGVYSVRIFINGKHKKTIPVQVDAPLNTGTAEVRSNPGDRHSEFLEKLLLTLLSREGSSAPMGPSITEMVTALSGLDNLRGKQESTMETFIKGINLGKDMDGGGGRDWKTELLGMAREALPAVTTVLQQRGTLPENPVPDAKPPVQSLTPEQEAMQTEMMLKQGIAFLKSQFMAGLDPESAIDFVRVQVASNPQYQRMVQIICTMDYVELSKLDPDIGKEPLITPFRAFYDGLRSEFIAEDSMGGDTGRDLGNEHHPGNNGAGGPRRVERTKTP